MKKKVQYRKGQELAFSPETIKELSSEVAKQRSKVITKETDRKNEFYHAVFVQDVEGKQGYILVKSIIDPLRDVHQNVGIINYRICHCLSRSCIFRYENYRAIY